MSDNRCPQCGGPVGSTKKFQVTACKPGGKVVAHVIRATDKSAAVARMIALYPGCHVTAARRLDRPGGDA